MKTSGVRVKWVSGRWRLLVEEAFAAGRTTETWYPIIAVPFPLKFVVVGQFLILKQLAHRLVHLKELGREPQSKKEKGDLPRSISLKAYITIRLLPSTLIILAVQLGVQLWLINRAIPPRFVASMTVFSSIRKR